MHFKMNPSPSFPVTLRLNPLNPHVVAINTTSSVVDPSIDLVVILHGFTGSVNSKSVTLIRDALLFKQNVTVVAVQYARLARGPWYDEAARNAPLVAQHLVNFLQGMEEQGLDLQRVHIIGFSLGAHVAGFTGALLEGQLGRITGLDPARPGFENRNSSGRLDSSDALFVVILHTGAGFVAISEPVGHVDFYPNGGSKQPYCQTTTTQNIPLVCNHFMSYTYFVESIYQAEAFPARQCSSWANFESGLCDANDVVSMGYHTSNRTRGLYFLRTNAREPYGLGQADHRINLDVSQAESASVVPHGDSTHQEDGAAHSSHDDDHNKDTYSIGKGLNNREGIEVQLLNDLDKSSHEHSSSSHLEVQLQPIFVVLSFFYFVLV